MGSSIQHEKGHFIGAGGLHLFFQSWKPAGADKKPILVFVHGMAEHSDRYQNPVSYFNDRDFGIYAMDLRGHGNSSGRRVYAESIDEFLKDIRLFVEHVRRREKDKKIFLIGHSFGGQLVLNFGAHFPEDVDGIVVSSPNVQLRVRLPLIKRLAAPILSRVIPKVALSNELDPSMVSRDPAVVEAYRNDPKIERRITTRLADIVLENHLHILDLAKKFRVPCFLMHAGDDVICHPRGTEEFFKRIPIRDKALKIYEGFYHELFNEIGREQVFRDMEEWITERM